MRSFSEASTLEKCALDLLVRIHGDQNGYACWRMHAAKVFRTFCLLCWLEFGGCAERCAVLSMRWRLASSTLDAAVYDTVRNHR